MNYSKVGYKIACWSFIIVGIGHILTDLLSPKTSEQIGFIQTMKDFTVNLLGTEANIFSFYQGFSLMMGILLLSYGLLNLFILRNQKQSNVATNIILLNIIIALICTILSVKYFFIVPIVLTGLAFLGFTLSFIKRKTV